MQIEDSSFVNVWDNYIHNDRAGSGCCDTADGIFVHTSHDLQIQGNVIANNESNIELLGVNSVLVKGNYLRDPRGPFPRGQHVQTYSYGAVRSSNVTVESNWAYSTAASVQEDGINFGFTDGAFVQFNYVEGGRSPSGCGILVDASGNSIWIQGNSLRDIGQCGIGVSSGTNNVINNNRVYSVGEVAGGGNTAIYVWNQYPYPCGPTQVTNNVATLIRNGGIQSGYWNGGGCGGPTFEESEAAPYLNKWNDNAIAEFNNTGYPSSGAMTIPPIPYQNRVSSPWTTN